MEGDLIALIQRTQTPNDCLTLVRVNGQIQGVGGFQRSLVCNDGISVDHGRIQEADGVCVVLGKKRVKKKIFWKENKCGLTLILVSGQLPLFPEH